MRKRLGFKKVNKINLLLIAMSSWASHLTLLLFNPVLWDKKVIIASLHRVVMGLREIMHLYA
jgi:hypothetical protein